MLNGRLRRALKLRERGLTLREAAAQVDPSVPIVMAAYRAYLAGVWAAVNVEPRRRKRGDGRQLTLEQEPDGRRLICDKTPDQITMGFVPRNRQAVAQLVRDRPGIELPMRTVG